MKTCLHCNKPYPRRARDSYEQYQQRKYCSRDCVKRSRGLSESYMKRFYALKGAKWISQKKGVPVATVSGRAHQLFISAIPEGRMGMGELAARAGCCNGRALRMARDTGTLVKHATFYSVPNEVGEALIKQAQEINENEKARLAGYKCRREAPAYLGISKNSFFAGIRGEGPYPQLARLRWIPGNRNARLSNPYDLEAMRREIRRERRAA